MRSNDVEHTLAVFDAAAGLDGLAEHLLLAAVMQRRHEPESTILSVRQRPPGERTRDFDDVLLGVAAVDANRVQLHQLARVVLVEAIAARTLLALRWHVGASAAKAGTTTGVGPLQLFGCFRIGAQ